MLATNVAETSLTVPGIRSVIDTGLARVSRYSPRSKVQRLPIEPVSRASADQRKGRCGRVAPGVCVRLFGESDFEQRPEFTDPEIQRTNLAAVILQMQAFGLGAVETFPFIDPPDLRQVRDGYQTLQEIGAIDEHRRLTEIGRVLARLPIDPKLGRMVLAAEREDCLDEMIVIAAGLSIQDPRERPTDKRGEADEAHAIWKGRRQRLPDAGQSVALVRDRAPRAQPQQAQGRVQVAVRQLPADDGVGRPPTPTPRGRGVARKRHRNEARP